MKAMQDLRIGISGWRYKGWKGTFYPPYLPGKSELAYASRHVNSIEINGSFYRLQKPNYYKSWYQQTPPDFKFSVKAHRYITHIKMLNDIEDPLSNFFNSGILHLKEKLGPILWQFPPRMKFNFAKFKNFLSLLPIDFTEVDPKASSQLLRYVVEVRNESFMNEDFFDLLNKYNVAFVFSDSGGKWPYAEIATSDIIYARLHGAEELYNSEYDEKTLKAWESKIRYWFPTHDIYIYFDNDAKVMAPFDAMKLASRLTDLRKDVKSAA